MVDIEKNDYYNNVKNSCKGGKHMRKLYLDNIRWITVVLVVIYHVIYMYNGVATAGVIGPFYEVQYQDALHLINKHVNLPPFQKILYSKKMLLK